MTHTPGPWKIQKGKYTGDDWLVGSIYMGYSEDEESELWIHITTDHIHASELGATDAMDDARLIAAAPQLLAALEGLLDGLDANTDERLGLTNEQWEQRIRDARQALAAAQGGEG